MVTFYTGSKNVAASAHAHKEWPEMVQRVVQLQKPIGNQPRI